MKYGEGKIVRGNDLYKEAPTTSACNHMKLSLLPLGEDCPWCQIADLQQQLATLRKRLQKRFRKYSRLNEARNKERGRITELETRYRLSQEELGNVQIENARLREAVKALPVEEMVHQYPDGSAELIGYQMQAQGEWVDVLAALEVGDA